MQKSQSIHNRAALLPYKQAVARYIRSIMALEDMRYGDLSDALKQRGVELTPENLRSKVSKGLFSADLLLILIDIFGTEENAVRDILKRAKSD